jgi:hypothetical protein
VAVCFSVFGNNVGKGVLNTLLTGLHAKWFGNPISQIQNPEVVFRIEILGGSNPIPQIQNPEVVFRIDICDRGIY